ncbi:MAG: hypothetical protein ACI9MC_002393 [Kiritimatiellia bacterium]|jgi:hypothetical protein
MTHSAYLSLLPILTVLTACTSADATSYMAWSEDGSRIATVQTDDTCVTCNNSLIHITVGDVKDLGDGTAKAVKTEQIIEVHDEPPPTTLSPLSLFFMSDAGYILVSMGDASGGTELVMYEVRTGRAFTLLTQEPVDGALYAEAIPSPDGSQIAVATKGADDANTAHIVLIDADDRSEIWAQDVSLDGAAWRVKWNTDNALMVGLPGGTSYDLSTGDAVEGTEPACWFPRTSSTSSFGALSIADNNYTDGLDGQAPSAAWSDCD